MEYISLQSDHISQVEGCFNKHISKTEYFTECLPKLRVCRPQIYSPHANWLNIVDELITF